MKTKRNSLMIKSVLYNDIAIVLSAFVVFFTVALILLNSNSKKMPTILEDSSEKILNSYEHFVTKLENNLNDVINSGDSSSFLSRIDEINETEKRYNEFSNGSPGDSMLLGKVSSELLGIVRNKLYAEDYFGQDAIGISIADANGNIITEALNFSGDEKNYSLYGDTNDLNNFKKNISKNSNFSYFDYASETDEIILRTYVETKSRYNNVRYIIVSTLVEDNFLEKLREYVSLDKGVKLFLLFNGIYIAGELNIDKGKTFFPSMGFINSDKQKTLEEKTIEGKLYSLAYAPIKDGNNKPIGLIGLGMPKYSVFDFTFKDYFLAITVISILLGLISHVFGKVYKRQFSPIEDLTKISKEISNGNFNVNLKVRAEGEIRELADAMKDMVKLISTNQQDLEEQNTRLRDQIRRTNMIEKLLLNIHSEDNVDNIIFFILGALTSEIGLDYGRAIYLEYDPEQDVLRGKSSATNLKFIDSENEFFKFQSGLKLHSESLDKVVKLITLDLDDNIVAESFKNCEIIYHNDRGFKFNLGSELLTSLGLNNFILFPIFTGKKSYGIILVDQSMSKKNAQADDIELLNLLSMNISIHFKNKELEKEKLSSEKDTTISYISSKILREIQGPGEIIKEIIEDYNKNDYVDREKIFKIYKSINKINSLSTAVLEYADVSQYNFEKLDLKEIVDRSIENIKPMLKNSVIELSKLYTHKNAVIANGQKLEVAVTQVLLNAIEAVDKVGGRLNITTKNKSGGVQIKITDNGIGIEDKHLKKVFDPFISTKGTPGLGLSIAKKIIGEHGGDIKIKSEPNKGTEVRILLNIYEEE